MLLGNLEYLEKEETMESPVILVYLDWLVQMVKMVLQDSLVELDPLVTQDCLACLDLKERRESVVTWDPTGPLVHMDPLDPQDPMES